MNGWILRVGIIAAVVIGGLIFRDRLSSSAGDLAVGDCYDNPTGAATIRDVQHHPCTEPHTAEVVFVGAMTGEDNAYPSDATVETWVVSNCVPAWTTYTGKDPQTEQVITLGWYQPTTEGWSKGERGIICYAARVDEKPMTSSVKKAP